MDENIPPTLLTQSVQERLNRLQNYVEKVEEAQAEMVRSAKQGKFEAFSEEEVRFHLSHDPNMIAEAGLFLAKIQRAYEYAKVDTQTIVAEIWNECNQQREELGLTNAKDRECWVKTQPRYIEAQQQEIEWKYNLQRMQVIYDRYDNLFAGSRKLANMLQSYIEMQNTYAKYN